MSAQAYADRLGQALERTGLIEVVSPSFASDRVSVLFRIKGGLDSQWLTILKNILLATNHFEKDAHSWRTHPCKVYFLKEINGEKKLVFGWNLTIISQDIGHSLDEVIRVISGGDPEPVPDASPYELTEFPLVGVRGERNVPGQSGKGASTIGGKSDFRPPVRR